MCSGGNLGEYFSYVFLYVTFKYTLYDIIHGEKNYDTTREMWILRKNLDPQKANNTREMPGMRTPLLWGEKMNKVTPKGLPHVSNMKDPDEVIIYNGRRLKTTSVYGDDLLWRSLFFLIFYNSLEQNIGINIII